MKRWPESVTPKSRIGTMLGWSRLAAARVSVSKTWAVKGAVKTFSATSRSSSRWTARWTSETAPIPRGPRIR